MQPIKITPFSPFFTIIAAFLSSQQDVVVKKNTNKQDVVNELKIIFHTAHICTRKYILKYCDNKRL